MFSASSSCSHSMIIISNYKGNNNGNEAIKVFPSFPVFPLAILVPELTCAIITAGYLLQ
jgi:hypothetical protein